MEELITNEIDAAAGNREHLVVPFYPKPQIGIQVFSYVREQLVERRFIRCQDHQVVGIPEIVPDALYLFQPVIESG